MKRVGRYYSWWVNYAWAYDWFDSEHHEMEHDDDFDEGRFYCQKKDIKKEVRKRVEEELSDTQYCNLKITIDDYYMTTAEEV